MYKKCCRCQKNWSEEDFNWKIKNIKRSPYCKECSREYIRDHYSKNKDYYKRKTKIRNILNKKELQTFIKTYLKTHPCIDCNESDIVVLEFDHKDKKLKFDSIAMMVRRKLSLKKIQEEIAKCEVRCANCHRRKTAKETNNWKTQMRP